MADEPFSFSAPDRQKKRGGEPFSFGAEANVGQEEDLGFVDPSTGMPAKAAGPDYRGVLSNERGDGGLDEAAKGTGTTVLKGLSHIPGVLGDYRDLGKFAVRGAHSVLSGRPFADVWQEGEDKEKRLREGAKDSRLGRAAMAIQTPSGEEFFEHQVKPVTGEYEATTRPGKWLMQAGEAGLSMLAPAGGITKAGRAVTEPSVNLAKNILMQGPKSMPIGAVAGGAGAVVGDLTESPGAALAASFGVPAAAHMATSPVRKFAAPIVGDRERQAGERLLKTTSDPEAALRALNEPHQIIPGSQPTTAQVTGDVKQGQAEKLARVHDPDFRAAITAGEGVQNEARAGVIRTLASPDADPTEVSKAFQRHVEAIEAEHLQKTGAAAQSVGTATQEAERLAGQIPGDLTPEGTGTGLRGAADKPATGTVSGQKAEAEGLFDKLYRSLDPDGKLNIVTEGVPTAAEKITKNPNPDLPPTKQESPIATPILEMAKNLKGVMPFNATVEFDQTITQAMKQAAKADDWTGHSQLTTLKGAVKKSINEALENQHTWEQGALARGEIRQEDMLAHNLQRHIDEWRAARQAGSGAGTGAATARAVGEGGLPPGAGGTGATSAGPGPLPSGAGAAPGELTPNFDPEAAQRLALANKGWGMHKDIYDPLAPALDRKLMGGEYEMLASKVPADAFKPGDVGYERAQQWLRGANNSPESVKAMQDIATMRLRESMKGDEVLTQKKLDAWKKNHANALRAIDEVSPGFSSRFDNAASATNAMEQAGAAMKQATTAQEAALRQAQKGVAAKFLNLEGPDDVTNMVGGMMNAKDSGRQITALAERMRTDSPEALEGLKKSVSDWMLHDLSTARLGPDNASMLSGARMIDFVHENPSAIRALYGDEGLSYMQQVSADLKRAQRVISNYASVPGSDTAHYLTPLLQAAQGGHGSWSSMLPIIAWEAWREHGVKGVLVVAPLAMAKHTVEALRAKGMADINRIYMRGLEDPEIGRAMLQQAFDANGRLDTTGLQKLQKALASQTPLRLRAAESVQQGEAERNPPQETGGPSWSQPVDTSRGNMTIDMTPTPKARASGGKVAIDHEAEADRLINQAEKARRNLGTEPLLEQPDERIVRALAIANGATRGG